MGKRPERLPVAEQRVIERPRGRDCVYTAQAQQQDTVPPGSASHALSPTDVTEGSTEMVVVARKRQAQPQGGAKGIVGGSRGPTDVNLHER
jgi:hypothetical protein